jgi:putative heme-binding domain-containing protein
VIDWSDTGECHEHDGIHRLSGRVFRISYGDANVPAKKDLTKVSIDELVELHASSNEWFVRHARRELADRAAVRKDVRDAVAKSRSTLDSSSGDVVSRLRALWTLYTLNALPRDAIAALLDERDEHLRAWGLRLATDFWPIDTVHGTPRATTESIDARLLVPRLNSLARTGNSGLVRLVLASTLQRLPPAMRPELAAGLLSHTEDAADHNLPKLIWYGLTPLVETDPEPLVPLAAQGKLPLTREWIARALAEDPVRNAAVLDSLLRASLDANESVRADIVRGLVAGLAGRRKAEPPSSWAMFQTSLAAAAPEVQDQVRGLAVVFGDGRALDEVRDLALNDKAKVPTRRAALETLIEARPDDLRQICERLLRVRFLNTTALKGLTLFDDPALGAQLAKNYSSFHPSERPAVIETLVTRPTFAAALLDQIEAGKIPAAALSALQARQIRSYGNDHLTARLAEVWGELRDSPHEKQQLIAQLKTSLTNDRLLAANASHGRAVFQTTCANCHRLFGAGGTIAPDLTGSGRHNLDYLLSNIVDPSAVVNKDFRMSVVRTSDGRVLNGLVMSQDDERVVLQTVKEPLTLMRNEIDEIKLTTLSPMPEGILQPLQPDQVRDLVAYLMSPGQVDLPIDAEFNVPAASANEPPR